MTNIKKLEKQSLALAHAVVDVRSWSTRLSYNLNKKKGYNLSDLRDEAQKIEDFASQLRNELEARIKWVEEHVVIHYPAGPAAAAEHYNR
jgi:hypothetical protein